MAGRGPAPKHDRQNRYDARLRGDPHAAPGRGWQYGDIPSPPNKLHKAAKDAWATWMQSWFAAHWTPEDLPGLRILVAIYDAVEQGDHTRAGELRLQMDTYGITPKGQQDRRWLPPKEDDMPQRQADDQVSPYANLRVVGE